MFSVYETLNYRRLLKARAQELKVLRPGFTLQKIAEKVQLQPPYLTNVLKERAHLNADQMFALCRTLVLNEDETGYALKLLEWERSAHAERKARLREEIEVLRKERLKTKSNLKKVIIEPGSSENMRYFLNPYYKIISFFIGVERFASNPGLIGRCLNLSRQQVEQCLKALSEMGFIKRGSKGLENTKKNFHLPRESPLCEPHQAMLQRCASQHMQSLPESEKFNFALTFSADEETRQKVQREFIKFLKTIEEDVKAAPAEQVYGLSFDLFRWSFDREEL